MASRFRNHPMKIFGRGAAAPCVGLFLMLTAQTQPGTAAGREPAAPTGRIQVAEQAKPAATPAAKPAAPDAKADAPAAWSVNCSDRQQGKFVCEMTQMIVDQRGGQVMLISIKGVTGGTSNAMLLRVGHGVYLPAGVSVRIDGGPPAQIAFQKSDQSGVYAGLPLDDKLVAELRKGTDLKLSIQINQGEPVEITARLNGFGTAYDRVNSLRDAK